MDGYKKIHERGIIHRDIKPSNMLIDKDGKIKISDFGFAIFQEDLQTQGKFSVGSTYYRAPETLYKFQYSPKSDIWAIGVVLFEMITGRLPWYNQDKTEFMKILMKQPIEKILPPDTNDELAHIIKRCLVLNV